jgi:hypothetical protein
MAARRQKWDDKVHPKRWKCYSDRIAKKIK